jgi:hypothetical protein
MDLLTCTPFFKSCTAVTVIVGWDINHITVGHQHYNLYNNSLKTAVVM